MTASSSIVAQGNYMNANQDHPVASLQQRISAVRRFNRFYTRQIGVLGQKSYESPYSLTEVRVLYEVAHRDKPTAAEISDDLGLDAGYLSRLLTGLGKQGLLDKRPSST